MTQALVNPVVTDAGYMPVTCNQLQQQEELLDTGQMGDTQGGIAFVPLIVVGAKFAAPYVATAVTAIVVGVVLAEITPNNGCNSCKCKINSN